MKKYIVTFKINGHEGEGVETKDIPTALGKTVRFEYNDMQVSDGYHTMDELYEHRIDLYIALCRSQLEKDWIKPKVWRSRIHSNGTSYDGWFILGIHTEPGRQITYHLPNSKWEDTGFAKTLSKAPDFDGHTSNDALERIKKL